MRNILFENFILDSNGFVIDSSGNVLENYLDYNNRIYFKIKEDKHYYDELMFNYVKPAYKHIKYLKNRKVWKTYVKASNVDINDNAVFDTEKLAAQHVNHLYAKYSLDRIPNIIPVEDMEIVEYVASKYIVGFINYTISSDGSIRNSDSNNLEPIKTGLDEHFYKVVELTNEEGYTQIDYVHELVAQAFVPNPDNLLDVGHIDGNKLNNYRSNLKWIGSND